ncbi:MAG: sodium:solute symporter family transporter [Planctomycetota bacterium]
MTTADWIVLALYLAGTVGIGVLIGRLVRSSSDLFAAGRQSPWWMSGLSAFMTMFSANTFVVWGGIAYQHGLVAVAINICYGIAALLAGFTVAGRWNRLGIRTPAEYIERRFGVAALHFYTWFMMVFRLVGAGGALYAVATLTIAAFGLGDGGAVIDPWWLYGAILVFALIIVAYTVVGGLWGVLMTDTLQFLLLNLAILFVVILLGAQLGDWQTIQERLPDGFLALTGSRYTWFFLLGWVAIHYFMIGAEWAFVQRYLCVESPRAARKSTFLFAGLYLLSPVFWLLPTLLWRVRQPIPAGADEQTVRQLTETAYIMSCKAVLPTGLLGLMLAALFSATASMISSQLNVFSAVLTQDVYRRYRGGEIDDQRLLRVGRWFTCLLGGLIALIAMATPALGGAAKVIIGVTQVMVTPLLAPALIGLVARRLDVSALWLTVGICFPLGLLAQFTDWLAGSWYGDPTFLGVVLPVGIVLLRLLFRRQEAPGWQRLADLPPPPTTTRPSRAAVLLPLQIIAWSLAVCAGIFLALIPLNAEHRTALGTTGMLLLLAALGLWYATRRIGRGIAS